MAEDIELHQLPAFVAAGKQHGEAHDSDDSGKARHTVSPIVLGRDYRSGAHDTIAVPGEVVDALIGPKQAHLRIKPR